MNQYGITTVDKNINDLIYPVNLSAPTLWEKQQQILTATTEKPLSVQNTDINSGTFDLSYIYDYYHNNS